MKTVTKEFERTVVETRTTYVANDGTEFRDEEQCKKYEESAKYALRLKFKDCMTELDRSKLRVLDVILDDSRDECTYFKVKFDNESQMQSFIAWLTVESYWIAGTSDWWTRNGRDKVCPFTKLTDLKVGETYIVLETESKDSYRIFSRETYAKMYQSLFDSALDAVKVVEKSDN